MPMPYKINKDIEVFIYSNFPNYIMISYRIMSHYSINLRFFIPNINNHEFNQKPLNSVTFSFLNVSSSVEIAFIEHLEYSSNGQLNLNFKKNLNISSRHPLFAYVDEFDKNITNKLNSISAKEIKKITHQFVGL